jgi:2-aminomuconate deaminase
VCARREEIRVTNPESVRSDIAAEPVGPYPHARRAGNLLFLSGIGPRRRGSADIPGTKVGPDGRLLEYDAGAELRACFENVRAVLDAAGARWDQIVDVTAYLTDLERDWEAYNRVYAEFFPPGSPMPSRTTVGVLSLPRGGRTPIHVEIKVTVALG